MTNENTAQTVETTVTESNRGRKPFITNQAAVVAALVALRDGDADNMPSRVILEQMVEAEYIERQTVKSEGRGRPRVNYVLTQETADWLTGAASEIRQAELSAKRAAIETMVAEQEAAKATVSSLAEKVKAAKAELKAAEKAAAKAAAAEAEQAAAAAADEQEAEQEAAAEATE